MRIVAAMFFSCLIFSAHGADPLQQCRALQDATARLQCYDQLVDARAATQTATAANPVPTAAPLPATEQTAPPPTTVRDEALFGTSGETIQSAIATLPVQVKSTTTDARQKLLFTMQNGQRWQQIDHGFLKVSNGDTCVISSGVFGSYKMKCQQGSKTIRVKRLQ